MAGSDNSAVESIGLPEEPVDRLIAPISRFLRIEAASGIVLLAATMAALFLANSPWADRYFALWDLPVGFQFGSLSLVHSLKHVINDGLMTLFFFVVGLEIKRELVLGELRELRAAALPVAAALGGMVVPAVIYLALQLGEPGERGWGAVMATDIAFVVGCLTVLGKRVPHSLRIFVLSLAIIDDIGAVLVIAAVYSADHNLQMLGLGVLGVGIVLLLRRLGVRSVPVFYLVGILTWAVLDKSGIHPTILGVVLGLLTPARPRVGPRRFQAIMGRVTGYLRGIRWNDPAQGPNATNDLVRSVASAARETISPLERLDVSLHPWVNFSILPLFAFANAGVPLSAGGFGAPVALAVVAGLMLGKPIGILGASWAAVRLGVAVRPHDANWLSIAAAGVLCGIGFTMSIFIANLAFGGELLTFAILGVLAASLASAILGLALLAASLRRESAIKAEASGVSD